VRPGAWAAAILVTGFVAWLQLAGLPWPARLWAATLLVPLPALMIVQARMLRGIDALPRSQAYISSIVSLWVLAALTLGAARLAGYAPAQLGLAGSFDARLLLLTAGLTAAGIGLLFAFRLLGFREAPVLRELLPVSTADRLLFVAVAATAGIAEELVFRGFLLRALHDGTGSIVLALLLSSGAFGVVHAYQRPVGALRAALLGALLAVPVLIDGSILAAILAHTLIDLLAGLWLARYLLRP
jgi:uncharacterized protein